MEYFKHYQKNFNELLKSSDDVDFRKKNFDFFSKNGFPVKKKSDERWKYLDLRSLEKKLYSHDLSNYAEALTLNDLGLEEKNTIKVINGVAEYSKIAGLDLMSSESYKHVATYNEDEFISLNASMSYKPIYMSINSSFIGDKLNIVYYSNSDKDILECPRICLKVDSDIHLTLNEIFICSETVTLKLPVTELTLCKNSKVFHNLVFQSSFNENNFKFTRVDQQENSYYKFTSFSNSSLIAANDLKVSMNGENSECDLKGIYFTTKNSQFNTHVVVDHNVPNTKSNQYFKGILSDESRAVFSGKIYVERNAQKTYAEQKDLNLVMSKGAEIDTKPSLEIYADDVECSHGATAGHVDESTLYYMMSRGIDRKTATQMLVNGFASEIIDEISDENIKMFAKDQSDKILPKLTFET